MTKWKNQYAIKYSRNLLPLDSGKVKSNAVITSFSAITFSSLNCFNTS